MRLPPKPLRAFAIPLLLAGTLGAAAEAWSQDRAATPARTTHGLSLLGDLKYPAGFPHLEYVDPEAPKGGQITLSAVGTFDSLNPFIIKGVPAAGVNLVYESLLETVQDEPSSEYGMIAGSIEVPEDSSWVAFTLRPEARFHDGQEIRPEDVIFSFETLKEKGAPFYRAYYGNVASVEKTGPRTVRFVFKQQRNRELPQIIGQLNVLPRHWWEGRTFDATTLEPPLGSGPYRVKSLDAGRSIVYERVADHWGRDLPIMRGRYNYDTVRFEYYRDPTVALEAFKAHAFDFRSENVARVWATAYDFPAVRDGRVVKTELPNNNPTGMQAFALNLRRDKFRDPKVREALSYAFDFEWTNKTLFYGQYARTRSYFSNSEMAATGLPSPEELRLLEPFRGQIPEEVFTKAFAVPATDGSGQPRENLRTAVRLLNEAGWQVRNGKLTDPQSGQPMQIEFLLVDPNFERIVQPFIQNLSRLGIDARIRVVDSSQYTNRVDNFDFDVVVATFPQSHSPGNEQRDFWGSAAADQPGSRNIIGIRSEAVDRLIEQIIEADTREELVVACRALDRVLLWGHYVVPNWHSNSFRLAYWNRFGRPAVQPKYGIGFFDTWWIDAAAETALKAREATEPK